MKKKRAVVAGHICLDITPVFPKQKIKNIEEVISPGKLICMEGVDVHTGGAVSNTGIAMKKLGADVSLMGKIGNDDFGALVLGILKKYKAGSGMIISNESDTSYSVVLAMQGIDRIFLHSPGANDTFSYADIDFNIIKSAELFHFGYPSLMKNMYMDQGAELAKLFKSIKELGKITSLDMAAIDSNSEAAQVHWENILKKVLPYVDFFVPSVEELCFMLDRTRFDDWTERANGKDVTSVIKIEDVKPLGQKVIDMGARVVLIKCGASGMYYRTAASEKLEPICEKMEMSLASWADQEGFELSYKPEKVVSGTGAGDTSIAAFLSSVLEGSNLKKALQMATATGACCVEHYDALSGIKSLPELERRINKGWLKNEI